MRGLLVLVLTLGLASCIGSTTYDFDGDGSADSVDCAPEDPAVHPAAPEVCSDGVDNDCDELIDCLDGECQSSPDCVGGDDDDSSGDDDDTAGDDDDSAGDDDDSAGDDDDSLGDDDDDSAGAELVDISPQGITLIALASGAFEMGCTAAQLAAGNCGADESPAHGVTLTHNFWMGRTEVTQAQWQGLMGNNPSGFDACGDQCPVETVTWWDAVSFANDFSSSEGLSECYLLSDCGGVAGVDLSCSGVSVNSPSGSLYDCDGYRLPTEAEWEYAARAGTDLLYSGSDTVGDVAWYNGNSQSTIHEVATRDPNNWGLYDMSGNVWEWVWDWYDSTYYQASPSVDPEGPATSPDSQRISRGGAWSDPPTPSQRVSHRNYPDPEINFNGLGFRFARTIPIDADNDGLFMYEDCDDQDSGNQLQPGADISCPGSSCLQLRNSGHSTGDGPYWIDPDGSGAFQAYCDMTTDGGGWMTLAHWSNGVSHYDLDFEQTQTMCTYFGQPCTDAEPGYYPTPASSVFGHLGTVSFSGNWELQMRFSLDDGQNWEIENLGNVQLEESANSQSFTVYGLASYIANGYQSYILHWNCGVTLDAGFYAQMATCNGVEPGYGLTHAPRGDGQSDVSRTIYWDGQAYSNSGAHRLQVFVRPI